MRDLGLSDESDRIVVSKDNLARCAWCGSPQSNDWVFAENGVIFCTSECMLAATIRRNQLSSITMFVCSIMILIPYSLMFAFGYFTAVLGGFEFFIFGIAFFVLSIAGFASWREGIKYQDRKGKYSGISPLECEYCKHLNPPSATRCLNCDATLSGASFASDSIPPWIHRGKKIKGVKCPHCNAVYSYLPSMLSDDRRVACQNCNRQFSVFGISTDTSPGMKRAYY